MVGSVQNRKQNDTIDETKGKRRKKKGGPIDVSKIKPEEMLKYEIAKELGLTWKQVDNLVTRYNKRKTALVTGLPSKRKGRPRVRPLTITEEYEKEIARLEMENKLLRDFLQLTERK